MQNDFLLSWSGLPLLTRYGNYHAVPVLPSAFVFISLTGWSTYSWKQIFTNVFWSKKVFLMSLTIFFEVDLMQKPAIG